MARKEKDRMPRRLPSRAEVVEWLEKHGLKPTKVRVAAFIDAFEQACDAYVQREEPLTSRGYVWAIKSVRRLQQSLKHAVHPDDLDNLASLRSSLETDMEINQRRKSARRSDPNRLLLFDLLRSEWLHHAKKSAQKWNRKAGASKQEPGALFLLEGMKMCGLAIPYSTVCDWNNKYLDEK